MSLTIFATMPPSEDLTTTRQLPGLRLYALPLPCGIILAGLETFPTLPVHLFSDAATHTPEGSFRAYSHYFRKLTSLRQPRNDSTPSKSCSNLAYRRVIISALQCSLYATASKIACPPNQSTLGGAARTFTSELSLTQSPEMRVGYNYTVERENYRGRTFTG